MGLKHWKQTSYQWTTLHSYLEISEQYLKFSALAVDAVCVTDVKRSGLGASVTLSINTVSYNKESSIGDIWNKEKEV